MENIDNQEIMVSIKCLAYNHERYIRKALDGFLMQKTNFKFEVIVHDDASTDNTAAIIREYEEKYPDIIKPIYQTENQHQYGNLSRRFIDHRFRGKYVAYCEGDDFWTDPNKLQMQVDYLEAHPDCSYTFHNASIVLEDGTPFRDKFLPDNSIFKAFAWENRDKKYYTADIINLAFIPTASVLGRREYIVNRKDFCENAICGDLPLRLSLSLDGYGYYFNRIMSSYRTGNPNSASGQASKSKEAIMNTFYGHKAILDGFNEYTKYRWDKEIEYDIKRRKFRSYFQTENFEGIRSEGLEEFINKEATLYFKMKYYMQRNFGNLYQFLKKIKHAIIK